jgi:endonuclease/exonuclease/phosphatase family metal-dependent hydrolase
MFTTRFRTATRTVTVVSALGVLASSTLLASGVNAAGQDPMYRKVAPPNVMFPVTGAKSVKDMKNFSSRHRGTDIRTPCSRPVYATHPGYAQVLTNPNNFGKYIVRVVSNSGGLVTTSAHLNTALVTNGQIIQSGQLIGKAGRKSAESPCGVYFSVRNVGKVLNPSTWLNTWVGKAPPAPRLFGTTGFNVASFNLLGASHTVRSSRFATYKPRLDRAVALMNSYKLDVVGTQEFQETTQFDYFRAKGYMKTWGAHYWNPPGKKRDTENAILWRKSKMEFVSGSTFDIPYFSGNTRHVPIALLRERSTGRTAYFLNVHNPADVRGAAAAWRARAIRIERAKIIELRKTGRPVFITGDFNDLREAFCPLTAEKLTISPNSVPRMTCLYPKQTSIDWIFAAGQARFSYYLRDTYSQKANVSDHPIVRARAHLQN